MKFAIRNVLIVFFIDLFYIDSIKNIFIAYYYL